MNLLHKHRWVKIFSSRFGTVDQCLDCHNFQTRMFDYDKNTFSVVPGNFLCTRHQTIHILCGTMFEFQHANRILSAALPSLQIQRLISLEPLKKERNPVIYLYGQWYENDLCQDPELTKILNGRI